MNANASRFDYAQCTCDGLPLQDREEVLQSLDDPSKDRSRAGVQHDYSGSPPGRKSGDPAEIPIERNQRSALSRTNLEQFLVVDAVKVLIPHSHHVMAGRFEELQATTPNVFIKLDLHATESTGTGIVRSRAASAP